MKKNVVYFKKDEIFYYNGKKLFKYTYENFYKNLPKEKVFIIFSSENVQQKIVEVPKKTKISQNELRHLMLSEVSDITNIPINSIKEKFVYNWRILGENEDNILYLSYIIPNEDIQKIVSFWEGDANKIKNIFWDTDIIINSAFEFLKNEEENIIFSDKNIFHYLAFKNNNYLFHRKIEVNEESDEDTKLQQFILELKRSYFYTKQQHKFSTSNFLIINPPNWIEKFKEDIETELNPDKLDFYNIQLIEDNLILSLFIKNFQIKKYISFIPLNIKKEKRLLLYSEIFSVILLIFLIIFSYSIYKKFLTYHQLLNNYINTTVEYTNILKETSKYIKEIKNLENLEIQKKEYEKILSKKTFSDYYLKILAYEIPSGIYLKKFNIDFNNNLMILSGKVDTKSLKLKNYIFQNLIDRCKNIPIFKNLKNINLKDFIKNGEFEITFEIKRVLIK